MRIAAIGDLHCQKDSIGAVRKLLEGVAEKADVLVLAGDLTDTGLPEEMKVLLDELKSFPLPIVAVEGNHDHEGGRIELLTSMMINSGIHVLNGTSCEIGGVGFAGTKGFCGGFDTYQVKPFGERALKVFIQTSIREADHLAIALADLKCTRRVAVLHYAPIKETLEGESPEVYAFLGSSLLAEALDQQGVDLVVHAHAHNGAPNGHTQGHIPVCNVSRFIRSRLGLPPYCIFQIEECEH